MLMMLSFRSGLLYDVDEFAQIFHSVKLSFRAHIKHFFKHMKLYMHYKNVKDS